MIGNANLLLCVSKVGLSISWSQMCNFHQVSLDEVLERKGFQKRCFDYLLVQDYPFDLKSCLEIKFSRWFCDQQCEVFSRKAVDILKVLSDRRGYCLASG